MMTQDGGFFFKKKKHEKTQPAMQTPLCPSPPTLASVFAPFARLFFYQQGCPGRTNPQRLFTPSLLTDAQ